MKKAVVYARYSSDKQTEQSIEGQVKVCTEYAQKQNLAIIGEYIDRAMTGTNDNRPEFQRMLADSKNGTFDTILVYKLDRFSRDKYESVMHKRTLKNNGVKVQSATEMISDTPEGILLESVIEGYNQFYSAELSQKVKRGNRMNIEKGLWKGGRITFGYKVIDKKIYLDDEKAELVRKMFYDYANGKTKKEIHAELNAKGVKTYFGTKWSNNCLQNNFKNKKYIGIFEYDGKEYNNIFPRIVDDEIFERVQQRLTMNKRLAAKGKAIIEYELTGDTFCLHCGSSVYGISGTARNGEKKCYYACKTRYKEKNCNKSNENKTELETNVVADTKEFISKPENLERASQILADFHAKNITTQKIKDLETRIAKIDREIEKLIDLALTMDGTMLAKIKQRSQDIDIQRKDLEIELNKLRFLNTKPKTKDDYKKRLQKFANGDINDLAYRKRVIHGLINSVWVGDGGVLVFYNTDNEKPLTLDEVKQSLAENGIDYNALCNGANTKCFGDLEGT